ncbi:MAG: hypothetical protein Fur0034_16400 [Desulfuromonadia bacterium]
MGLGADHRVRRDAGEPLDGGIPQHDPVIPIDDEEGYRQDLKYDHCIQNPATILIVDDEPFVLRALSRLLRGTEFTPVCVDSAREALEYLKMRPNVGIVLADYRMPGKNGVDLLSEVYRIDPLIRRVIFSGFADFETILAAINAGHVHKFIPKPWDDQELLGILRDEYAQYLSDIRNRFEGEALRKRVDTLSTRRRELELSLAEKHELLKKSERRLHRAQIIARLGDWEWYRDREELLWSEGMYPLFDLDPESFTPTRESFISLVHPDDREEFVGRIQESLATPIPFTFTHRFIAADGTLRYLTVRGEPILDGTSRQIGISGTTQDETDRILLTDHLRELNQELEERVRERTRQLEEKVEELDSFVSAVSHDLRAPMRHVAGFAEILKEQLTPYLDEIDATLIDRIIAKSQTALKMAEALLSLARLGREGITRTDLDLSRMAGEILADLAAAEPTRRFRVTVDEGLTCYGDHQLVSVLLTNLLGNAVKYTGHREEGVIHFGATASDDGGKVFVVEDNGDGFDMQYADKLFHPFQRLHSTGEFPGIGIGLATVHRIVTLHGGWIRGESEPGKGTRFLFTLEP